MCVMRDIYVCKTERHERLCCDGLSSVSNDNDGDDEHDLRLFLQSRNNNFGRETNTSAISGQNSKRLSPKLGLDEYIHMEKLIKR